MEAWVKRDGSEYIIRRAVLVGPFVKAFEEHGVRLEHRLPGEFSEAYRVLPGFEPLVHRMNEAWFRSEVALLAMGNIFIFHRGS